MKLCIKTHCNNLIRNEENVFNHYSPLVSGTQVEGVAVGTLVGRSDDCFGSQDYPWNPLDFLLVPEHSRLLGIVGKGNYHIHILYGR